METTQIQCPNCNANIDIHAESSSATCPDCGRILLIEHVVAPVRTPGQPVARPKVEPEAPLSREDKIAGVGLLVLLMAVAAVFFGLTLKIYFVWLAG